MNLRNLPTKAPVKLRPNFWSEILETLHFVCFDAKPDQATTMQRIFSRAWEGVIFIDDNAPGTPPIEECQHLLRIIGLRAKRFGHHWVLVASGRPSSSVRLPPLSVSAPTIPENRPIQLRSSIH